jgi:phosphoribosyl-AMP cyclohydrolase / phosphoribosyl-ATP pyrophosphohydrolase
MLVDYSVLRFNEQGLIPAIVQDITTGRVLMLAYMNREALERTLATRLVHYWSRSRAQLWQKGETSGHIQHLRDLRYDCDADTLLVIVEQEGVACHTGAPSCFFRHFAEPPEPMPLPVSEGLLQQIYTVVQDRKRRAPQESYVASLMTRGQDHVLKKVVVRRSSTRWPIYGSTPSSLWVGMIFPRKKCSRNSSIVLENLASVPTRAHPCIQLPGKVLDDIVFSC